VPALKIEQVREHLLDLAGSGEARKRSNERDETNEMRPGTTHLGRDKREVRKRQS